MELEDRSPESVLEVEAADHLTMKLARRLVGHAASEMGRLARLGGWSAGCTAGCMAQLARQYCREHGKCSRTARSMSS